MDDPDGRELRDDLRKKSFVIISISAKIYLNLKYGTREPLVGYEYTILIPVTPVDNCQTIPDLTKF